MPNLSFSFLLPGALIVLLLSFALYYIWACMPRSGTVEWIHMRDRPSFQFIGGRYPLGRLDVLTIILIVAIWVPISLFNLGAREAPQSFHEFQTEFVAIDLGGPTDIGRVRYYTGLGRGEYALYFSPDGMTWERQGEMNQGFAQQFKWLEVDVLNGTGVRYVRLQAEGRGEIHLGELAIYNTMGLLLDPGRFTLEWSNPAAGTGGLFDEQYMVPDRASFHNSMYFDEIYHGQAAYQMTIGEEPTAELSHPPLGKILMGIGIHIFGMTPFGWRFMGAILGAAILAIFYCLVKQMFDKRLVAVCATIVFAASFMHFTQTRIATIDTYAVLFVLLQFWFMYRYISQDYETPFRKTLLPLGLTGFFFGLGAASKWTSLYLAPALVVLWVMYQVLRWQHFQQTRQKGFRTYLWKTILVSCGFFLLLPGIIYSLSYIPYSSAAGYSFFSGGHWRILWENQQHMWYFHGTAVAELEHSFSSRWWQWALNIRPILYYSDTLPDGLRSVIVAFGNPAVYWGGLLAIFAMPAAAFRRGDGRAFAILLCYVALLLPWVFIARTSFAYHYFTNSLFLVLALAYVFDHLLRRRRGRYKAAIVAFTGMTAGLFLLFYPALSGWPMSHWYAQNVLRWFQSWPI